ncbi:MAG: DUF4147 domain-containing protein [Flexistipes sinusarabici]|uniref:DUF4147 domain-containing protein n=1 Tax=Flexistipes sinusarabici TaxID=2352 RepID=A0A5D0MGF5_FLESI|nr:DUF4147 domain-containing protein [Flexistipes sinusarabici]TYB32784.1 MAG: DUF4147 domain-containing protein [Flexistipes sinusarabici]
MSLKQDTLNILHDAVNSVKPDNIFDDVNFNGGNLNICGDSYDLNNKSDVYILGSGKASVKMAEKLKEILGRRISGGLVVSNYHEDIEGIEVAESSHPLPDESSLEAGSKMLEFAKSCKEDDFIIYLLSGGTSSLLEYPAEGIGISDINTATDILMKAGADITELNTLRKKLSQIKGGRLAAHLKCEGVVLVLSDVVGDDLNYIGSAPLYYDCSSEISTDIIFDKYSLYDKLPKNVIERLKFEKDTESRKSLKHYILGNNNRALLKAAQKAEDLEYKPVILTSLLQGEASVVAGFIVSLLKYHSTHEFLPKPLCFIAGGETMVTVKGDGKGGRNQELALAGLSEMGGLENVSLGCIGTDGIDGNSDAAGAVVTPNLLDDVSVEELKSYLKNNDSNTILTKLDSLIKTGNTGTNVCDIYIGLVG